ncbi:MAG: 2-amino-4-hydroxy-6-hydroxymethyldihydropteridine diphosphokinase [Clostridia bacterium]|nr:2-amino-4-hydroxy-6-hydroxymethyldihydropteridine diphosphokinase [Clostridia bacterium]
MKIKIRGLEISARHGVHGFEKTSPQRFVFDVDLTADFYSAAKNDDLNGTVNYSAVCSLIEKVAKENVFNLIEKLAFECAFRIMENFPAVSKITLTVNKPDAPLKVKFKTVAAEVELARETAYLSLGSSEGDKKAYLDAAIEKLNNTRGVNVEKISSYIETAPVGGVAKNTFLNCAVQISTVLQPRQLLNEINRIESECGRKRTVRWADRTLDIDVIFFGSRVIREQDLIIPHPRYLERPFVLQPLKSIAPEFFCPDVNKYLKDL